MLHTRHIMIVLTFCVLLGSCASHRLILAINNGNLQEVKSLAAEDKSILTKSLDRKEIYPLHQAIFKRHFDIVKYLVSAGADINVRNNAGQTPLHYAVVHGQVKIAEYLVSKGADINVRNNAGHTPLYYAVDTSDIAEYLVAKGADIDIGELKTGVAPIHRAIFKRNFDIVKILVSGGADINVRNNAGHTPLHYAVDTGQANIAEYLVAKGAGIYIIDNEGYTPSQYAMARGRWEMVQYVDSTTRDEAHRPLQHASKQSSIQYKRDSSPPTIEIFEPFVERGMKVVVREKKIWIRGNALDESGVYEVLVNGTEAKLSSSGEFVVEVLLAVDDNHIRVQATDTKRNVAEKSFIVTRKYVPLPQTTQDSLPLISGEYHALLIACQNYSDQSIENLDHPIRDAIELKNILTASYSFNRKNVTLLSNPDRSTIINEFDKLNKKIGMDDSLLIFYAGHGYWDHGFRQGYWIPSNASKHKRAEWISNATVRDFVRGIQSRHTLLIADACFSGGIFKSRKVFRDIPRAIQELLKVPSRKAITSGTLNEVPDKSVFVEYLLKRLRENNDKYLPAAKLFSSFRQAVINNSPINQVPQFGEIREAGDEGGDFVFTRRN